MNNFLDEFKNSNVNIISLSCLNSYINYCLNHQLEKKIKYKTANHHVLPKSMFPQYSSFLESPWNKVILYHKDHYFVHWLLTQSIDDWKFLVFFSAMHNESFKNKKLDANDLIDPKEYQLICEKRYEQQSINYKGHTWTLSGDQNARYGLTGELSHMWGKKLSTQTKEKLSKKMKEKWEDNEYKEKMCIKNKESWNDDRRKKYLIYSKEKKVQLQK